MVMMMTRRTSWLQRRIWTNSDRNKNKSRYEDRPAAQRAPTAPGFSPAQRATAVSCRASPRQIHPSPGLISNQHQRPGPATSPVTSLPQLSVPHHLRLPSVPLASHDHEFLPATMPNNSNHKHSHEQRLENKHSETPFFHSTHAHTQNLEDEDPASMILSRPCCCCAVSRDIGGLGWPSLRPCLVCKFTVAMLLEHSISRCSIHSSRPPLFVWPAVT